MLASASISSTGSNSLILMVSKACSHQPVDTLTVHAVLDSSEIQKVKSGQQKADFNYDVIEQSLGMREGSKSPDLESEAKAKPKPNERQWFGNM